MCMMGNVSFNIQSNPSHERTISNPVSKNVESIKTKKKPWRFETHPYTPVLDIELELFNVNLIYVV
jgi:hypothetical protein